MKNKRGFSILELLLVMAIIVALAGLLFVVVGRARGSAYAATCVNNTKEVYLAFTSFVQDNNDGNAPGQNGNAMPLVEDGSGIRWTEKIVPYMNGDTEAFCCPVQVNTGSGVYGYGLNPTAGAEWWYMQGFFGGGFTLMPTETRPRPFMGIRQPSMTVLICDSGTVTVSSAERVSFEWVEEDGALWTPYVSFNLYDDTSKEAQATSSIKHGYDWGNTVIDFNTGSPICGAMGWDAQVRALARHGGKCSAVFADGHVEQMLPDKLTDPQWGASDCLFDNQK